MAQALGVPIKVVMAGGSPSTLPVGLTEKDLLKIG
jgi:hypothetical protein